ncbi:SEC63, partial [Symbiodinium microadriaticum]
SKEDFPATKVFLLPRRITYPDILEYLNATTGWHKLLKLSFLSDKQSVEVSASREVKDSAIGKKPARMGSAASYVRGSDSKRQRITPKPQNSPKAKAKSMSRGDPPPGPPPPLPASEPLGAVVPALEFEGVRVFVVQSDGGLGLTSEQKSTVENTVVALGGHVAADAKSATHAVFPNQMMKADWLELEPIAAEVWQNGGKLVTFRWFQEVTEGGLCAQDPQECTRFMPEEYQQLIAHGKGLKPAGKRVSRVKAPSAAAPELTRSLQQTKAFLQRPSGEEEYERDLRKAIEASLKDAPPGVQVAVETPEEVLGVQPGATADEVKAAYRRKVKTIHPDKGGDSQGFVRVRTAYLALSSDANLQASTGSVPELCDQEQPRQSDFELREHHALVRELFEKDGVDLELCLVRQMEAMSTLGLEVCDLGAINRNERGEDIYNQCFYLALARSYLGCDSDVLKETALMFKRNIEAAVLAAHPEWGGSRVGEDVQAFSDFLFYVLGSHALLAELSVAVFDASSGGVELYIGRHYPGPERLEEQRSNLLTLRYCPGHYEALVPKASYRRPLLAELQEILEKHGVALAETKV